MIDFFRKQYFFLSNFYEAPVVYEGLTYTNNEAAFQSAKTLDINERRRFTTMSPSEAKKEGRRLRLRPDWESVKTYIMLDICRDKFTRNAVLKEKLLSTGSEELIEGNTWGDMVWGMVDGVGENRLGKILMQVRDELNSSPAGWQHGGRDHNGK